ncbi:LOW QUALITY PROTEIN: E3 ubiquitin-protein ligase TRIM11-like [Dasypus novemcinctus]|uniref:LOW QUALITY PROTEIN: E3 ubiquitin-protein ligase TRIM11-like n=1 Tax=Dasypus novemcinctus TaxID=9361 RepID=UPI0039C8E7E6
MAARSLARDLQDEATCPICLDLFAEPVSLGCGHNFCRACVDRSRGAGDAPFSCPECRELCAPESLRPNRPLGRVAAALARLRPAQDRGGPCDPRDPCDLCAEHLEPLKLFCEDDRRPVCVVCHCASAHPLPPGGAPGGGGADPAGPKYVTGIDILYNWQNPHIGSLICGAKVQGRKQRTVCEFQKFRKLLAEDELRLLQELEEEEEAVMQKLRQEESALAQHSRSLEELTSELKERGARPALGLFQGLEEILRRIKNLKIKVPVTVPMELKTVCKVPGLLEVLRRFQVEVTLDPESAHPSFTVSVDQRAVTQTHPWASQSDPEKPLGAFSSVLGRERFTAGRHYWEVEVRDGANWILGVCREDCLRAVSGPWGPGSASWSKGHLFPACAFNPQKALYPRVGVFLDYEARELSFYNVNEDSHLHTIALANFPVPVRPIFVAPPWCQTRLTVCARQGDGAEGTVATGGEEPPGARSGVTKPFVFVFGRTPAPAPDPPQPPQLES